MRDKTADFGNTTLQSIVKTGQDHRFVENEDCFSNIKIPENKIVLVRLSNYQYTNEIPAKKKYHHKKFAKNFI